MSIEGIESVKAYKTYEFSNHAFSYIWAANAQIFAVNLDFWKSLPADIQQAIEALEPEMIDLAYDMEVKGFEELVAFLKPKFKTWHIATPEQMAEMSAGVIPMHEQQGFLKAIPPGMLQKVLDLGKQYPGKRWE